MKQPFPPLIHETRDTHDAFSNILGKPCLYSRPQRNLRGTGHAIPNGRYTPFVQKKHAKSAWHESLRANTLSCRGSAPLYTAAAVREKRIHGARRNAWDGTLFGGHQRNNTIVVLFLVTFRFIRTNQIEKVWMYEFASPRITEG